MSQNQPNSTSPEKSQKPQEDLNGFKPVHKNTLNLYFKNGSEKFNFDQTKKETSENLEDAVVINEEKMKPFNFSKLEKSESQKSSPSPTSAFSWSKFKFTRNNSSEQLPQLDGNKNVKSQFKKVVSESNLEKYLKKQPEERKVEKKPTEMSYEEFLKRGNQIGIEDVDEAQVASLESDMVIEGDIDISPSSSADTESYPYSIDSACISQTDLYLDSQKSSSESQNFLSDSQIKTLTKIGPQSQQNDEIHIDVENKVNMTPNLDTSKDDLFEDNPDTKQAITSEATSKHITSVSNNVFKLNSIYFKSGIDKNGSKADEMSESEPQEIVNLIDSDDDDTQEISSKNMSISTPKNIESPANPTSKSSMKSGCRVSGLRKGSKKQSKTVVNDAKQQNLKDMFSKFAHQKGDHPKLTHKNEVMSEDDKYTPEGCKSILGTKSGTQKRIL